MKRKKVLSIIYSLIITTLIIIGTSFILTGNFKAITKHPILFLISSGLLYKIINEITIHLYDKLDENTKKEMESVFVDASQITRSDIEQEEMEKASH